MINYDLRVNYPHGSGNRTYRLEHFFGQNSSLAEVDTKIVQIVVYNDGK